MFGAILQSYCHCGPGSTPSEDDQQVLKQFKADLTKVEKQLAGRL